jgi:signal transduction histidine kinase
MRSLSRASVRSRIAALLAVLVALWAFAAWVTVRESLNLLYLSYLETAGLAAEDVVEALQQERRLSTVVLGGAGDQRSALTEARTTTDQRVELWREVVDGRMQRIAASDRLSLRYDEFAVNLAELDALRLDVDTGAADRTEAFDGYTGIVEGGFALYQAMSNLDDQELARQSRVLLDFTQARELLARQDALLAGAQAAGELTEPEILAFTQLVGGQRLLYDRVAAELVTEDRALYDQAVDSPAMIEMRRLEARVISDARPGAAPPVTATDWDPVAAEAMATMRQAEIAAVDNVVGRATPVVAGILARLLLAGFLGLVAVVLSVGTGRTLIRQLEQLRDTARDLAGTRLPRVVGRLSRGEEVDVATEAPPVPDTGGREIGELATAFNAVQQAAVQAAVDQADLRRGVRDVFLNLARRTQSLVRRQLKVLDEAEQDEADPDKMAALFRIDHLAARMRRNAENLIVLSGASTGRTWRRPVTMMSVARGAISEVEDYTRVNVLSVDPGALAGQVAGDVIHLLAELVENAVSYSPPYAPVTLSGHRVARGFAFEIEDRGLGMSEADLAAANRLLADPPDFNLADSTHLGHYVVARLAERHDIQVKLRSSPYGGVAVIVLIPVELIVEDTGEQPLLTAPAVPSPAAPSSAAPSPAAPSPAAPGGAVTPAGLPWRVRQTNMPKELQQLPGQAEPDEGADDQPALDPETVRLKMTAFQRGTARGRDESTGGEPASGRARPANQSPDSQEG